jgi:hypothetical protein
MNMCVNHQAQQAQSVKIGFDPVEVQRQAEMLASLNYQYQDAPKPRQSMFADPQVLDARTIANYEKLDRVLQQAYDQAAVGKGQQRHGNGLPFEEQPMQALIDLYGGGFALGQAAKKMQESQRMETPAAIRELLGAIVYISGAIIALEAA